MNASLTTYSLPSPCRRPAVQDHKMYARVVDFGGKYTWQYDKSETQVCLLIAFLLRLGFRVKFDNGMEQPRNACGAVAPLAAALLSEVDWKQADVSLAAHSNIISNAVSSWLNLGVCAEGECPELRADHVAALYQFFKSVRTALSWYASFSLLQC